MKLSKIIKALKIELPKIKTEYLFLFSFIMGILTGLLVIIGLCLLL